MKFFKNITAESLRSNASIALIVIAAILVEVTSIIQYMYAQEGILRSVENRAQGELRIKSLKIQNVMNEIEVAVREMAWAVERDLDKPGSMVTITQRLLDDNKIIVGSAVAFEPNYYKKMGVQFAPYSYRVPEGRIISKQLGTNEYDYHHMEWYAVPMQTGKGHWSEPYFDKGGGEMMMSTYSQPICDKHGNRVAVLTADVSLDWLSKVINDGHNYASSLNLIVSRTGKIMAGPKEAHIMRTTLQQLTDGVMDTSSHQINRNMLAGKSGQGEVEGNNGDTYYVFYTPISLSHDKSYISANEEDDSGWSMAVICSDREIYQGLRNVLVNLNIMLLLGLTLMGFIVYRMAKSGKRLARISAEKEHYSSELRIASNIQHGMLPKEGPVISKRDDLDLYGSLIPAKEVGGDLYDFYVRDEKLFFCIGDVSGKGVPASLVMAVTRSLFRSVSAHEAMPGMIMAQVNNAMTEMNETNMFVTLFIGVLDLPTGRLRYSNAGHCPPMLINPDAKDNKVSLLPVTSNIPLGFMHEWRYNTQETTIDPPTAIFLYTDGLTEAEAEQHEQFGEKRMLDVAARIKSHYNTPYSEGVINQMHEAVETFVGDNEQTDDLTMLAIQYTKQHREMRLQRSITLPNDVETIPQLATFVEKVCIALDIDDYTTTQLNLAMEEAVVNVMEYAYPVGKKGNIHIEAQANEVRLKFTITDSGKAFDPTARKDVDTSLSAEERSIGGLGIHLVRQIMDSINYERIDDKNVLTLRKKLS
ncbi:MAG: SpoIIE family protein phosphatase [Prevotella sp.]|nr:SpoIIE family protein phosphatase [Prevotella sp.]